MIVRLRLLTFAGIERARSPTPPPPPPSPPHDDSLEISIRRKECVTLPPLVNGVLKLV